MRAIRDLQAHRGDDQPLVEYRHADVPAENALIADPDVCVFGLAISALEEGFNLQVMCDGCGSGSQIADAMAGAAWILPACRSIAPAKIAESIGDWAKPAGAVALALLT